MNIQDASRIKQIARSLSHLDNVIVPANPVIEEPENIIKPTRTTQRNRSNESMCIMVSAFYAKLLIVMGIALPVTDAIRGVSPGSYNGFYIYMYSISVTFLTYLYIMHVKEKSYYNSSIYNRQNSMNTKLASKGRFGSFYLHMGVAGFGMCSIMYSALQFGEYFEITEECDDFMVALKPFTKIIFMVQQMIFVFSWCHMVNSKKYEIIMKFGIMHLIATNICVWLDIIIEDAKRDIEISSKRIEMHQENTTLREYFDLFDKPECYSSNIMRPLIMNTNPYLSPCSVEYSVLCTVILTIIWKDICFANTRYTDISKIARTEPNIKSSNQFYVDCAKAQKGLFVGIIVVSTTIISLILFFELVGTVKYSEIAVLQVNIWETVLFIAGTTAVIACTVTIRKIGFRKFDKKLDIEHALLYITQSGVYIYSIFQVIGCSFTDEERGRSKLMRVVAPSCAVVQSSFQTLLILEAWRRRCISVGQIKSKPGRQLITFLLSVNIALWIVNRVKNNRAEFHPMQVEFYGIWAWTIITHVSMPLVVSYRFQSTVCFYEMWKHLYKTEKTYNDYNNSRLVHNTSFT